MSLMYFWCFYWNFRTYFIFILMVLLLTQNRLIINRQETKNKSLKHYKPRSIPPMKSKFYRNFNIFQFLTVFELTWIRRWGNICCQTLVTHLHGNFFSLMYIVFLFFGVKLAYKMMWKIAKFWKVPYRVRLQGFDKK